MLVAAGKISTLEPPETEGSTVVKGMSGRVPLEMAGWTIGAEATEAFAIDGDMGSPGIISCGIYGYGGNEVDFFTGSPTFPFGPGSSTGSNDSSEEENAALSFELISTEHAAEPVEVPVEFAADAESSSLGSGGFFAKLGDSDEWVVETRASGNCVE
jgi:hypothetical protein